MCLCVCVCVCVLSRVRFSALFPAPGDLPNPGIEPTSLVSPALAGRFFTTCAPWEFPEHVPGIYQIQGVRELKNFYSN